MGYVPGESIKNTKTKIRLKIVFYPREGNNAEREYRRHVPYDKSFPIHYGTQLMPSNSFLSLL